MLNTINQGSCGVVWSLAQPSHFVGFEHQLVFAHGLPFQTSALIVTLQMSVPRCGGRLATSSARVITITLRWHRPCRTRRWRQLCLHTGPEMWSSSMCSERQQCTLRNVDRIASTPIDWIKLRVRNRSNPWRNEFWSTCSSNSTAEIWKDISETTTRNQPKTKKPASVPQAKHEQA